MRTIDADVITKQIISELRYALMGIPGVFDGMTGRQAANLIGKWIDEQPTVEVEPVRHGRWIKMTGMLPPEYHGHYYCSECQWHMKGLRNSWTREEELLYCPNCGARMDADE